MSDQQSPKAFTDRLRDYEDSSSDNLEPVELLADDFMRRNRAGENPTIEEYCSDHPELADEIREVFPAIVAIERVAPDSADLDESANTLRSSDHRAIESIGDYRILREIGRGGMGVVYEAEQESLGRRVALKVLPRHVADNEKALLRFQREARAAAKMHHTNIVPVFDVGKDKEYSFYAMQLIKGQGLDHVIGDLRELRSQVTAKPNANADAGRDEIAKSLAASLINGHFEQQNLFDSGDVPEGDRSSDAIDSRELALAETTIQSAGSTVSATLPGRSEVSSAESNRAAYFHSVAEIGLQASRALAYAHARGITHRDIKPSNLILDTAGVVWITDFGLARTDDSSMTQTGDILGTIRYMSPERFKGQCDNRADVYSLGLTLYELLVLKPAFVSPDRLKLIDIVTKTEVTAPRSLDSRIPRDLETIVLKACDKDPKRRYQSADEMADDIQRFVSDEPILARRASPTERVARWTRRNPWLATAMSVSAIALLAIAGISVSAAQTQTTLNEQLVDTNQELNEITKQQRETNQALVDSNRSKEEMIQELKSSQSRLAEKQAELVGEQGDVAESMLWLARSYELTAEDESSTKRRLYRKLGNATREMPRLIAEAKLEPRRESLVATLLKLQHRNIGPVGDQADEKRVLVTMNNAFRSMLINGPQVAMPRSIMAVPIEGRDESEPEVAAYRFWDVGTRDWTGTVVRCNGMILRHALHEERRLLVTLTLVQGAEDTTTRKLLGNLSSAYSIVVHDIDTGEKKVERKLSFGDLSNAKLKPELVRIPLVFSANIQFSTNGNEFILTYAPTTTGTFTVAYLDADTGRTSRKRKIKTKSDRRGARSPIAKVSLDGKWFICTGRTLAQFNLNRSGGELLCFNIDTDMPYGKPIPLDGGSPLILTEDASRVATVSKSSQNYYLRVYDVETGESTGEPIMLSQKLPELISSDGKHLFVATSSATGKETIDEDSEIDEASPRHVRVSVYNLSTGMLVGSSVPAWDPRAFALAEDSQTLTVLDSKGIRVWQLHSGRTNRTIFPAPIIGFNGGTLLELVKINDGTMAIRHALGRDRSFLGSMNSHDQGELLVVRHDGSIFMEYWNADTGELNRRTELPESEGLFPVCCSPDGRFVVTARVHHAGVDESDSRIEHDDEATSHFAIQIWEGNRTIDRLALQPGEIPLAIDDSGNRIAVYSAIGYIPKGTSPNQRDAMIKARTFDTVRVIERKTRHSIKLPPEPLQGGIVGARFSSATDELYVVSIPSSETMSLRRRLTAFSITDTKFEDPRHQWLDGPKQMDLGQYVSDTWAVSNDGRIFARFVDARTIQVKRTLTGEVIDTIKPRNTQVIQMCFSTDGRTLFAGSIDGFIRSWSVDSPLPSEPEKLSELVEKQTGLQLDENGSVIINRLADDSSSRWRSTAKTGQETLRRSELSAVSTLVSERWEDAEAQLDRWISHRKNEWLPYALQVRPLLNQEKFEKATIQLDHVFRAAGKETAQAWLSHEPRGKPEDADADSKPTRYLRPDSNSVVSIRWRNEQLLKLAGDDTEQKANALFKLAKCDEMTLQFDSAVKHINRAVSLTPDNPEIQYYRAHLMERLGRWDEAMESRIAMWRLEPETVDSPYRVLSAQLFNGQPEEFHKSWAKFYEESAQKLAQPESDILFHLRDRIAKPRLLAGGPEDENFEIALKLADANYESPAAIASSLASWRRLCKGLAEFRRGEPENLRNAIEILDTAFTFFEFRTRHKRGAAMTRFVAAMAHHQLGNHDVALKTFLDGLDRHQRDRDDIRRSPMIVANDWQLAEIARREASDLIGYDKMETHSVAPETTDWTVLLEDDFDTEIAEDWKALTGDWEVVDGAAQGTLEPKSDENSNSFVRLEIDLPELPPTFELSYEVWATAPMIAAMSQIGEKRTEGQRVALAYGPDMPLADEDPVPPGVNLAVYADFDSWFVDSAHEFKPTPNDHYHVRIVRQPERLTAFIDGQQVISGRVPKIQTRAIRFFARGEEGGKIYLDNVRVRIPTARKIPSSQQQITPTCVREKTE